MIDVLLKDCFFAAVTLFPVKIQSSLINIRSLTLDKVALNRSSYLIKEVDQLSNPNYEVILNNFTLKNSYINSS